MSCHQPSHGLPADVRRPWRASGDRVRRDATHLLEDGRRYERRERGGLPAALLFDMDGLLVDSEPVWTIAERELAAHYGREFTAEVKAAMIGKRLEMSVPLMLSMLGVEADPLEAGEWLLVRTAELFHEEGRLALQPGAADLLGAVAVAGVPTALVSSSYRRLMDAALDVVGRDRFAVTVAGDEVGEAKPHPEPYLTAAGRLGVAATACVVLKDSETGARSGVAAGCATVLVPTFPPVGDLPGVTVVASLHEVTLELLGRLAAA